MRRLAILISMYARAVILIVTFPITALRVAFGLAGPVALAKRLIFLLSELNLIGLLVLRGVGFSKLVYLMRGGMTSWCAEPPHQKFMSMIHAMPGAELRVLNFGAGDCRANKALQAATGARLVFTNLDVLDRTRGTEAIQIYNGMDLPIFRQPFDLVYTSFVLHHTPSYKYFLNQLKFLAPWTIVVDDTPANFRELLNQYAHVYSFEPWRRSPYAGYDVQTRDQLRKTFTDCGLSIVSEDLLADPDLRGSYNIHDVTRTAFLLKSPEASTTKA